MGAGTATSSTARDRTAWRDLDLFAAGGIQLDESGADGKPRSWIMIAPVGTFEHEKYGELRFTRAKLAEMKGNFDERVRHIDIALDVDHDQGAATGWLERLELRDARGEMPAGLWGLVRWTPYGAKLLAEEQYRYFSPEFGDWKDPESGHEYHNVLMGGALTNRPFLKTMGDVHLSVADRESVRRLRRLYEATAEAVRLMEISRRPWSSVNKRMLPRSCFLIPGDPDHKDTWKLPVYEGTGPKDADGCYTRRGALNINGVRAALAAIGGARQKGGTPMRGVPAGLTARLERWIQQYGAGAKSRDGSDGSDGSGSGDSGRSAAASERAATGKERSQVRGTSKKSGSAARLKDQRLELERDEDLGDPEDEEREDEESYQLADDMGGDDGAYDEADGDGSDGADDGDGDEGDDGFNPKADRHGPMTTDGHLHGKYAEHSHDGDADHSDAELKESKKASTKASGRERGSRHGRDERVAGGEVAQLREEVARMRYQLYEKEVGETLSGWKNQTFQFREGTRKDKDGKAVPVMKSGRIALSKAFSDKYKAFMLTEAIRLSERQRTLLNDLVETALSTAIVDLSSRGSSFDQESRRTVRGGEKPGGADDSDRLQDAAERMALAEEGKPLTGLAYATQMALYERAAREIGYR